MRRARHERRILDRGFQKNHSTYGSSLLVAILVGVARRCGVGANGPLTVSVDLQLSAPELA